MISVIFNWIFVLIIYNPDEVEANEVEASEVKQGRWKQMMWKQMRWKQVWWKQMRTPPPASPIAQGTNLQGAIRISDEGAHASIQPVSVKKYPL